MSTCARCGAAIEGQAATECDSNSSAETEPFIQVECRDRELANLRSLLRSVTGKLEEAADLTHYNCTADRIESLINQVLEALS